MWEYAIRGFLLKQVNNEARCDEINAWRTIFSLEHETMELSLAVLSYSMYHRKTGREGLKLLALHLVDLCHEEKLAHSCTFWGALPTHQAEHRIFICLQSWGRANNPRDPMENHTGTRKGKDWKDAITDQGQSVTACARFSFALCHQRVSWCCAFS